MDEFQAPHRPTKSRRKVSTKSLFAGILVVVILALAVTGGLLYRNYSKLKKENAKLSNPQAAAQVETDQLKSKVGQLIELPNNESPTVATVVDAGKLKTQAFFANAQNGDRVLIFSQAKKAILYRPSTNKIIEVAPINIGDSTNSSTPSTTPAPATTTKPKTP